MRPALKTTADIQRSLDKMISSGGPVDATKSFAGIQPIDAGELKLGTIRVSHGQTLCGQETETFIIYKGGPTDPPLFQIIGREGRTDVEKITLRDMQIFCPNGGRVVALDRKTATKMKLLTMSNVVIRGGVIDLSDDGAGAGEHYLCRFEKMQIFDPKEQALRVDGQHHLFDGLEVFGTRKADPTGRKRKAVVEVNGSSTWQGCCHLEMWTPDLTLRLAGWTSKDGYHHRGNHDASHIWFEEHVAGDAFEIDGADFEGLNYGPQAASPIVMKNNAGLYLKRPINPGSVKGQGKLFVNGVEAIGAVK